MRDGVRSVERKGTVVSRPVEVRPLGKYRVWLRYDDGVEGQVDLADLAGRGVFRAWEDPEFFAAVRIGAHGEIAWSEDIDLCPDAIYLRLTGKTPEQLFPNLRKVEADA